MALYVRLQASFYTHRKTARLRSLIGKDALWLPPRLWCYAATNQPDGDFSDYSAEELALLLEYTEDATKMLEALQQAGYMDEMQIHDWPEHNEYHSTFKQRATNAANARWSKPTPEKKGKDKKGQEQALLEHATSILPESLSSAPMKSALSNWMKHRSEIKKPVTKTALGMLINRMSAMGPQRALAAIEHSISNGWQGLFEPDPPAGQKPKTPAPKKTEEPKEWKDFLKSHPKIAEVDPVWSRAQEYIKQEFYAWLQNT